LGAEALPVTARWADADGRDSDASSACARDAWSDDGGSGSESPPAGCPECAICLGTAPAGARSGGSGAPSITLACGHPYCPPCLLEHAKLSIVAHRAPWCPQCRERLTPAELREVGLPEDVAASVANLPEGEAIAGAAAAAPLTRQQRRAARRLDREFRRAARAAHLKRCPSCRAPIEKTQGCDHMKCRCGNHFNWSKAETVVPCRKLHWGPSNGLGRYWGRTCKGCSIIANAKLAAWRTAGVSVAVPAAAATAAVAVTGVASVALVPAVVCAPFAAAYEPYKRLRGKHSNPFAKGMRSGVMGLATVLQVLDNDSD